MRMVAVRPRRWGLWLLTAGFLLVLAPSALNLHSLFGLWPPMLGALCIIMGVPLLAASVVLKRRSLRQRDRKSVVSGKSVSVRVDHGGRRIIKKQTTGLYDILTVASDQNTE